MTEIEYGRIRDFEAGCDELRPRLERALAEEGFGVLTEIDVRATMKKKLDVDVPAQWIFGACNPPAAREALRREPEIGLLLPCNVVLREREEGGSRVAVINPRSLLGPAGNPRLEELADDIEARLERVLAALER